MLLEIFFFLIIIIQIHVLSQVYGMTFGAIIVSLFDLLQHFVYCKDSEDNCSGFRECVVLGTAALLLLEQS